MSDLLTTLHPINDNNTDLYPNVKRDNLPQNVKDELDAIPGKVDKEQGKGLSTNDFTNADKALVNTIPDKVDKVAGKGLSTNDFTNADKALVDTIPDKVDKVPGKGLSTNDYTNADKNAVEVAIPLKISFLNTNILDLYRMVIRSGGMITVTDASVALASQPFPLTVSQKALLNYVGGMCHKIGDSIITAPVTTVVSKGFNLWDEEWEVGKISSSLGTNESDSTRIRSKNYIPVSPNANYYFKNGGSGSIWVFYYDINKNYLGVYNSRTNVIAEMPSDCYFIRISPDGSYGTTYKHNICINVSNATMNGTYKPYSAPVYYPIHRDIRALDGYGYGLSADCYNYIDFEGKKFVKKVARVDLGSLDYTQDAQSVFRATVFDIKRMTSPNVKMNGLCSKYAIDTQTNVYSGASDKSISGLDWGNNVQIRDNDYTNPATFKAAMSGVYLYYELATPVETDISDLLVLTFPTYDIINVLSGGYLEFENENNIGVPYSVTYQSKPNVQSTVLSTAQPTNSEVDSNDPTNSL